MAERSATAIMTTDATRTNAKKVEAPSQARSRSTPESDSKKCISEVLAGAAKNFFKEILKVDVAAGRSNSLQFDGRHSLLAGAHRRQP